MSEADELIQRLRSLSHQAKKLAEAEIERRSSEDADEMHDLHHLHLDCIERAKRESFFAAAEIQQLREERDEAIRKRDEAIRKRDEYLGSWLEWLQTNDGLEIREWLLAYADATPEPTDSEEAETICGFIDRKMIAAAAEIQRLREERDEARRGVRPSEFFADLSKPRDCRTISRITTESPRIDPKME